MRRTDEIRAEARARQVQAMSDRGQAVVTIGDRDARTGLYKTSSGYGKLTTTGKLARGTPVQEYPVGNGAASAIVGPMATEPPDPVQMATEPPDPVQPPPVGYFRGQIFNAEVEVQPEQPPVYVFFDSNWLADAVSDGGDALLKRMLKSLGSRVIYQPDSWSGAGFYFSNYTAFDRVLPTLRMTRETRAIADINGPVFLPLISYTGSPDANYAWFSDEEKAALSRNLLKYGGLLTGEWNAFFFSSWDADSKEGWYWLDVALLSLIGVDASSWNYLSWRSANWLSDRGEIVAADAPGSFEVPPTPRVKAIAWADDAQQWAACLRVKPKKPL